MIAKILKTFVRFVSEKNAVQAARALSIFFAIFASVALFFPSESYSTTFSNRPLGEVIREAPLIVRGRTRQSYSDWGKGAQARAILTYTEIEVTDVIKGQLSRPDSDHLLVRQPGGAKDGMELSVPGTAFFGVGEDVVLTLGPKDASDGSRDVMNFAAGKYSVVSDESGTFLVNSLGGGEVYSPHTGDHSQSEEEHSFMSKVSLDVFKKIAAGQETPESKSLQFKQQAATSDHKTLPVEAKSKSEAVASKEDTKLIAEDHSQGTSQKIESPQSSHFLIWIIAILFGGAILIWVFLGRRGPPG